jgi:hypothetical protein
MNIRKENDEFDFWEWSAPEFITARPFKEHLNEIRFRFIGLPINSIHAMGNFFNRNSRAKL